MKGFLIVGLGNPGKTYDNTRHNIGFEIVDAIAKQAELKFSKAKAFKAEVAKGEKKQGTIYLLKPQTYMNLSGEAVSLFVSYHQIPLEQILVITDDFALPFGELRLKPKGSSGGHNGLKDIELRLQTQEYPRLRIGIGDPGLLSWPDYVLEKFTPEEKKTLPDVLERAVEAVELWLDGGIDAAMRRVNIKKESSE